MFEEYFKAHFGHVHKDIDYLEREKLKKAGNSTKIQI